jgi:AraC-like DNA-binding protein
MEDIRYYLANTDLTINEISDTLGFPNASFFGKYFKQQLGCTPQEYRNRMKRG